MKKLLLYILIIITLVGIISPIKNVSAVEIAPEQMPPTQTNLNYTLLTPLPCDSNANPPIPGCVNGQLTTYDPTQNNNFSGYLNMMIKLFIGICAVLAVVMIVMGGIEYMTSELISSKEAGKERIRNAILGLLLALGAWTLLYTINPNLLKGDLESLAKVEVSVELKGVDTPQSLVNGKYADGSVPGTPLSGTSATLPNGVILNNGGVECKTVGQKNCTSTKGLNPEIVNSIAAGCSSAGLTCNLVITGGTESWEHSATSSHKPGSSTVDMRATTDLNKYITGGGSFPTDSSVYKGKSGTCYYAEPVGGKSTANHWHIYKC